MKITFIMPEILFFQRTKTEKAKKGQERPASENNPKCCKERREVGIDYMVQEWEVFFT